MEEKSRAYNNVQMVCAQYYVLKKLHQLNPHLTLTALLNALQFVQLLKCYLIF